MIPLSVNPTVVILMNPEGKVEAIASNVASDLKVVIVESPQEYRAEAANKPFDTLRPVPTE